LYSTIKSEDTEALTLKVTVVKNVEALARKAGAAAKLAAAWKMAN